MTRQRATWSEAAARRWWARRPPDFSDATPQTDT